YWLHTRFLLVEGQKMSKSRGNFYTARDLFARGVEPAVLRYELMRTHYRSNLNFTQQGLEDDSRKAVARLRAFAERQTDLSPDEMVSRDDDPVLRDFKQALADDLNVSEALGVVFRWVGSKGHQPAEARGTLAEIDKVLGVLGKAMGQYVKVEGIRVEPAGPSDDAVAEKCKQIDEARSAKDYARADAIRAELEEMGIEVQTTKEGTTWRRQIRLSDS
ncbi:MAG: class I tRNA ligase family protein, partial [Phycisphaerae bacterium]|nr:class I tRNA ligase family protein [Phycisphaerae bacterium]